MDEFEILRINLERSGMANSIQIVNEIKERVSKLNNKQRLIQEFTLNRPGGATLACKELVAHTLLNTFRGGIIPEYNIPRKIYGGFNRDWTIRGRVPNDLDVVLSDKESFMSEENKNKWQRELVDQLNADWRVLRLNFKYREIDQYPSMIQSYIEVDDINGATIINGNDCVQLDCQKNVFVNHGPGTALASDVDGICITKYGLKLKRPLLVENEHGNPIQSPFSDLAMTMYNIIRNEFVSYVSLDKEWRVVASSIERFCRLYHRGFKCLNLKLMTTNENYDFDFFMSKSTDWFRDPDNAGIIGTSMLEETNNYPQMHKLAVIGGSTDRLLTTVKCRLPLFIDDNLRNLISKNEIFRSVDTQTNKFQILPANKEPGLPAEQFNNTRQGVFAIDENPRRRQQNQLERDTVWTRNETADENNHTNKPHLRHVFDHNLLHYKLYRELKENKKFPENLMKSLADALNIFDNFPSHVKNRILTNKNKGPERDFYLIATKGRKILHDYVEKLNKKQTPPPENRRVETSPQEIPQFHTPPKIEEPEVAPLILKQNNFFENFRRLNNNIENVRASLRHNLGVIENAKVFYEDKNLELRERDRTFDEWLVNLMTNYPIASALIFCIVIVHLKNCMGGGRRRRRYTKKSKKNEKKTRKIQKRKIGKNKSKHINK